MEKVFKNGTRWERVSLTDADKLEVIEKLAEDNKAIMEVCIRDAQKILQNCEFQSQRGLVTIAVALFDKLATASFTAFQEKLEDKANQVRQSANR